MLGGAAQRQEALSEDESSTLFSLLRKVHSVSIVILHRSETGEEEQGVSTEAELLFVLCPDQFLCDFC